MTRTLYKNAAVFDGNGEDFQPNVTFVVDDVAGTFAAVGNDEPEVEVDQIIDLSGKYVMPGMINAHTHIVADPYGQIARLGDENIDPATATFVALENLQKLLANGVTYIRDVGAIFDIDIRLSQLESQGHLFAPGIVSSGKPLAMTGGHFCSGSYEVDGEDEVRKVARLALKNGADNIKLMATGGVSFSGERPIDVQLTEPELRAAVEEAHHKGRTACAHAQGTEGIKNAIRAGVDSVEHAIYLDDEAIDLFLETGTYIVPTLIAPWAINQHTDILPDFMVQKSLDVAKDHVKSIGRAAKAGVKLAMGTDSGTAFNDFEKASAFELELMVDAGVTPLQALQSTTCNAADLLNIQDRAGRIETGKLADFLILDKNPLEDIRCLQEEKQVFKKGKKVVG